MIYIVRQSQTDWNLFKRCNGITETFLNQTCEIVYNGLIVFDDRLIEIICGEFEGKEETAEMMKQFGRQPLMAIKVLKKSTIL